MTASVPRLRSLQADGGGGIPAEGPEGRRDDLTSAVQLRVRERLRWGVDLERRHRSQPVSRYIRSERKERQWRSRQLPTVKEVFVAFFLCDLLFQFEKQTLRRSLKTVLFEI